MYILMRERAEALQQRLRLGHCLAHAPAGLPELQRQAATALLDGVTAVLVQPLHAMRAAAGGLFRRAGAPCAMMPPVLVGLLGLGVLLTGIIALELMGKGADDGAMIANTQLPATPTLAAAALLPRSDRPALMDGILARPLFATTRRPAIRLAGPAAAPVNLPRLTGILINGRSRSVIFAAPHGGRPVVAQEGAQIGPYTVQSIEARQVTLSGPDGTQTLRPAFAPQPTDGTGRAVAAQ